ncbi:MAG TPA: hypothetical protein VFC03_22150 [Acidimicrobiales bacterium]|nr:hypothetical protein [Acidimicrobiales bacterium]
MPEAAAVAVLVAIGALIVGGVVAGIVASTASDGGLPSSHIVAGNAISFGAQWAGPVFAIVLLGVVGLCWWQSEAWSDASEPDDEQDRELEVAGHVRRARQISYWTQVELALVCPGAIALVIGGLLLTAGGLSGNSLNWARTIDQVVNLLAVLVIAGGGLWIGRRVGREHPSSD